MKPAIRLEISKKDENTIKELVREIVNTTSTNIDPELQELADSKYQAAMQNLITTYRTKLHAAFKMGLTYNPLENKEE